MSRITNDSAYLFVFFGAGGGLTERPPGGY